MLNVEWGAKIRENELFKNKKGQNIQIFNPRQACLDTMTRAPSRPKPFFLSATLRLCVKKAF